MDKSELKVGSPAPKFNLPDQEGKLHSLDNYSGQWILVYFYPKDDTPGCVKEACSIRDAFPDFENLGIKVFGVSADSVLSHKKFSEKYSLQFTLLSDTRKKLIEDYGVLKEDGGTARTSFLINPAGKIAKIYNNVKPENHAMEIINDLAAIKDKA